MGVSCPNIVEARDKSWELLRALPPLSQQEASSLLSLVFLSFSYSLRLLPYFIPKFDSSTKQGRGPLDIRRIGEETSLVPSPIICIMATVCEMSIKGSLGKGGEE